MRELCWHAVAVRHQHERRVAKALESNGVEMFVPLYRARRRWSDRVKEIDAPLFPGYVFARGNALRAPGVIRIVGRIEDAEIGDIRKAVESKLALGPWPYLKAGDRVRIREGPLRGVEGTLLREQDCQRLVIAIELLKRSITVELEPEMVMEASV